MNAFLQTNNNQCLNFSKIMVSSANVGAAAGVEMAVNSNIDIFLNHHNHHQRDGNGSCLLLQSNIKINTKTDVKNNMFSKALESSNHFVQTPVGKV